MPSRIPRRSEPTRSAQLLTALTLLLPLAWPLGLAGQDGEADSTRVVAPGSRVRITAPAIDLDQKTATIEEASDTVVSIRYVAAGDTLRSTVAREQIEAMDLSTDRHRHPFMGLLVGAAVGAGFGAFDGAKAEEDWLFSQNDLILIGAAQGALAGIVPGFLIGLLIQTDEWTPLTDDGGVWGVEPTVSANGVGVGMSFGFPAGR